MNNPKQTPTLPKKPKTHIPNRVRTGDRLNTIRSAARPDILPPYHPTTLQPPPGETDTLLPYPLPSVLPPSARARLILNIKLIIYGTLCLRSLNDLKS